LSPSTAKEAFLAIYPSSIDWNNDNRDGLETPLENMFYVPLAIQLLAQVSIGYSSQCVLIGWYEEKTDMLATGDGSLENINMSISFSIAALFKNPGAVSTLCQLSDGLYLWEEHLPFIRAEFKRIHHLLNLQQMTALIFIVEDGRPTVMSPIRRVDCHRPSDPQHIHSVVGMHSCQRNSGGGHRE
jgi:hypothetical protein